MNWYSIFYWLTVADSIKTILFSFGFILSAFCCVCFIVFVFARNGDDFSAPEKGAAERSKKWLWWSLPFAFVTWIAWAALPTKKDSLLIIAGGGTMNFLTTDSAAKEVPHEAMNFVVTELRTMAAEAKVDLGIENQKEKVIESAKQMTASELIEKIKSDSTFAKIIME